MNREEYRDQMIGKAKPYRGETENRGTAEIAEIGKSQTLRRRGDAEN
jgi:hypothetical protein